MLGIHDLPLFIVAGLLLNITPGVDMALVATRSAAQGLRGGALAALGICAGCLVHTLAAALGLSALLAASATAFTLLRWAGAAYLVWIGIGLLRAKADTDANTAAPAPPQPLRRLFAQGFLTNALNPKVAIFFLAFVPQFIAADASHKALAFVLLGLLFIFDSLLVLLAFAWAVAHLRRTVGARVPGVVWLQRGVGALFVAFGLKLALGDR